MPRFTSGTVGVNLGFLDLKGDWEPDEREREAAWEMYVELVTRITAVELKPNAGLLREALNSYHTLFDITREILKKYGPAVAPAKSKNDISFGRLAVEILNVELRPVLTYWHPRLLDYENAKSPSVSVTEYESQWDHANELRQRLEETRLHLICYADVLAKVARVRSLVPEQDPC